jgi:hypothetical protein
LAARAIPAEIIKAPADIAAARQNMGRILLLLVALPSRGLAFEEVLPPKRSSKGKVR